MGPRSAAAGWFRRVRWGLIGLLLAAGAGCGSTVQGISPGAADGLSVTGSGAALQGTTGAGPIAATSGVGGRGTTASGLTAGAGAPGSASPGSSGGVSGLPGTSALPAGASSGGAVTGPITLGFAVVDSRSTAAAYRAVGGTGEVPDELGMVRGLVSWLNRTGGIAGRKVVAVIHQNNITNGDFASQAQAACADFTQDHHVLAVGSSPLDTSDNLIACLAQAHTPLVAQMLWPLDSWYYQHYPGLLYQPGRASPNRWVPTVVSVLDRAGYFANGAKVGLVSYDAPVFQRLSGYLHTALGRFGQSFAQEAAIGTPGSIADFGTVSAEAGNAIVRFRAAGINRVMFAATGVLPYFFMREAESQGYRPMYGLSSNDAPAALLAQGAPPAQMRSSLLVGWLPSNDVTDPDYTTPGPALRKCEAIMRAHGVKPIGFYSDSHCDTVFFLRAVLSRLAIPSASGMPAAVARLGTSYGSPLTFATSFTKGRPDGASEVRLARFSDACTCFRYSGPATAMP